MRTFIAWACLVLLVGLLGFGMLLLHPFGEPAATNMDDYMIANAQQQTGSNNVVTSILFDYRGFDTLGEATVLFAAVGGVILVLRTVSRRRGAD